MSEKLEELYKEKETIRECFRPLLREWDMKIYALELELDQCFGILFTNKSLVKEKVYALTRANLSNGRVLCKRDKLLEEVDCKIRKLIGTTDGDVASTKTVVRMIEKVLEEKMKK